MRSIESEESGNASSKRFEKLYTMLLDAIPSSVLTIDPELRITSANRNFLLKSRRTLSNTVNQRLETVFPAVILEQMNIIQQIREVFHTNRPTKGQRMSYRSPGVPMRVYYYSILPFSWEERVENVMLLMDDVTEQMRLSEEVRRVERHMASVFESASDIILSTDIQGKILSWNPAAEIISGYTLNEVGHKVFSEFLAKDPQQELHSQFSAMNSNQAGKMMECDLMTKDGVSVPVSWVFSPMKDQEGRFSGTVAVGRDLTERRKLELQLLQSQKFAALGVMAGGIAHEIRNPLAICSSSAQFLMKDNITPEFRRECADKIHTGIQRATIIIENLLRFARPSGKSEMEPVNLSEVIKEALALIANQAKIQKIEPVVNIPPIPVMVNGNASLLQQVFINLFLNGIEAMPNGGSLDVGIETKNRIVQFRMADTGLGIPRENIDKIFDPFYTTSPVGKGTGLGLSICYSIVKQHQGVIEVESDEGKGSIFTVMLPRLP